MWRRIAVVDAAGSVRLWSEAGAGPVLADPGSAWSWTQAWLEGRVEVDRGEDLLDTPVDLVALPVRCRGPGDGAGGTCGRFYGAVLYAVVRLSERRKSLGDVAIYVDSRLFSIDLFWALPRVIASSGGVLGPLLEDWRDSDRFKATGHRRWPHCPECGAPAPEHRLSRKDAVRAPPRPWRFLIDGRPFSDLKFPGWRIVADRPVQGSYPEHDPVAACRMTEGEWRRLMERAVRTPVRSTGPAAVPSPARPVRRGRR